MKIRIKHVILPARALFYAVVVSLLIALVCSLLIGLAYLQRLQQDELTEQQKLIRNLKSGIALLMGSHEADIPFHKLDLFGNHEDSIAISKSQWGLFSVVSVISFGRNVSGGDTLRRTLLVGEDAHSNPYPALYLVVQNQPLVLAGNTMIRGTAFVPAAGIKTAIIGGKPYTGASLIYGERKLSTPYLPPLNERKLQSLFSFFSKAPTGFRVSGDSIRQSFIEPTLYLVGTTIDLSNKTLLGNIIVQASNEIIVPKSAKLEDVLLFAPKISFEKGFEGTLQAYATQALEVKAQCRMGYPSVLGLICPEQAEPKLHLTIDSSCVVEGCIFAYPLKYFKDPINVTIGEKTLVKGWVWAKGEVDLRGSVYGSVLCNMFILATSSYVMKNTLVDAIIDRSRMPDAYVSPFLNEKPAREAVAKWIE
ncbi:MAG: hypothetical protein GC192_20995 [Bacteroidetes bacterium]|nr:hypothetical protein [Bacteroidota bacterium]